MKKPVGAEDRFQDDAHAAILAAPLPLIIVEAQSLRLYAVNAACAREFCLTWKPDVFLPDLFVDGSKVESFLRRLAAQGEEAENASPGGVVQEKTLPCLLKTAAGNGMPLQFTLFFIQRISGVPSLLFLAVNAVTAMTLSGLYRSFDAFPEMLFLRDLDGRLILCNRAFARACKKDRSDILGRTIQELDLPPSFAEQLCVHDRDVISSGLVLSHEIDGMEQDSVICYENNSFPDFAPDGSIRGIFGMCRDISMTKATAEALQHQRTLLQATNDAALLLFSDNEDIDALAFRVLSGIGVVTKVDQADVWRNHESSEEGLLCTQLYSWAREHNTFCRFSPSFSTTAYRTHLPGWEEQLASGACINTLTRDLAPQEYSYLESQGLKGVLAVPVIFHSSFWGFIRLGVRDVNHSWSKEEEDILRSVGLLLAAIIQRRQIQEALSESEERFRDVTLASGEIIWELDAQGYFSYVSERMFTLTGYLPEKVRGMRWEDFALDAYGEALTGHMFHASAATGSFQAFEHRIKSRDGREIWLFASGKLLLGPSGIAGLRGTSLDITQAKGTEKNLKATLKALEVANKELEISAQRSLELAREAELVSKAKSEFLANMSHEVRTPLNAVIGMTYLLRNTDLSPKQQDYVSKMHAAGASLLSMVNDILDFSKIESGKLEIEQVPFGLESLFEAVASSVGSKAEEQNLDVILSIAPDVPRRLIGDSSRIGQVLNHLVGNAVKFTEQGGVDVRCSLDKVDNGQVHLRVAIHDTGIGISEEQQSLLFKSFSQVDASITRKYGGTGLGLAISKNLLRLIGGDLSLKSALGEGTTITVFLPLAVDPDGEAAEADANGGVLAGAAIALVAPSGMQRAHLCDALRVMGCRVTAFGDIEQCIAAVAGSDDPDAFPRAFVVPMSLVEEDNGKNILRLRDVAIFADAFSIVAVAPFGFDESRNNALMAEPSLYPRISVITRPLLSTALNAALIRLFVSEGERAKHTRTGEAAEDAVAAPSLPECEALFAEDDSVNRQVSPEPRYEAGIDKKALLGELVKLNTLLRDDDAAACQMFTEFEHMIKKVDSSAAATAAKALSMFDFVLALSALAPVEKGLAEDVSATTGAAAEK
ncbi:MAG: PAS domain S-box protein [Desulfovibrio sp.]|nr:PAS domain S-box protein [Desulfovibrio sp.]